MGACRNSQIPWKGLKLYQGQLAVLQAEKPELPNSLEGIETMIWLPERSGRHGAGTPKFPGRD